MSMPPAKPLPAGMAPAVAPSPSNTMGLIGFILSLVGFVFCGLLSPIACLVSLIGMFKEPRGFAVAGFIISLIGSVFLATIGFFIITAVMTMMGLIAAVAAVMDYSTQFVPLFEANSVLVQKWEDPDKLPTTAEGNDIIEGKLDAWDKQIKYETNGTSYSFVSAGADGKFDNDDDRRLGPFRKIVRVDINDESTWPADMREEIKEQREKIEELKKQAEDPFKGLDQE